MSDTSYFFKRCPCYKYGRSLYAKLLNMMYHDILLKYVNFGRMVFSTIKKLNFFVTKKKQASKLKLRVLKHPLYIAHNMSVTNRPSEVVAVESTYCRCYCLGPAKIFVFCNLNSDKQNVC